MDDVAAATIDRQLVEAGVRLRLFGGDSRPLIADRYRLIKRIGEGGMGVVYAADDTTLGRHVALKMAKAGVVEGESFKRHVREAQALAKIGHPNIVAVYDLVIHATLAFVAIELVSGETVRSWTTRAHRPWRDVLRLMLGAARGLAAAHAQGLVHRDFKPENVMVTNEGVAKVLDFGLVRPAGPPVPSATSARPGTASGSTVTRASAILGTIPYMAPEQYEGGPIDERADQYSFCATLFETLYGRPARPNGDVDVGSKTRRLLDAKAPPRLTGVPASVTRAVMRGLSRSPADRFPSMDALIDELGRGTNTAFRRPSLIVGAAAIFGALAMKSGIFENGPSPSGLSTRTSPLVQPLRNRRSDTPTGPADAPLGDSSGPVVSLRPKERLPAGRARLRSTSSPRRSPSGDIVAPNPSGQSVRTALPLDRTNPFHSGAEAKSVLVAPLASSPAIDRSNPFRKP